MTPCPMCDALFEPRSGKVYCSKGCGQRASYIRATPEKWKPRPCRGCERIFTPIYGLKNSAYCSPRCLKRTARRREGSTTHRARARKAGVPYETVDPLDIMRRDRWTCQVCGAKTPEKLRGSTRHQAPELDHIVPLALKGPHTAANLQCACRSCNLTKGAQWVGQRRLFG